MPTDPHVPVINWTTIRRRDGAWLLVPASYAEAIRTLQFLNDFRIRCHKFPKSEYPFLYPERA